MDSESRLICLNISSVDLSIVWHAGLLAKLFLCLNIKANVIKIVEYPTDRELKFTISGLESSTTAINAGVPRGSIQGPLVELSSVAENLQTVGNLLVCR